MFRGVRGAQCKCVNKMIYRRVVSSGQPLKNTYASATTDTGFKHLLCGENQMLIVSLLNELVPWFHKNKIVSVVQSSIAVPILKSTDGERQQLMDLKVKTDKGHLVIVEMQARRHENFDERVLFYAASTYARQLTALQYASHTWYNELQPVVAVQIVDYDSNKIRGIKTEREDKMLNRVKNHPMKDKQFVKNYVLHDQESGQSTDHIQLVQIELPRANAVHRLFPPEPGFTMQQWWLSVLSHATDYTEDTVSECSTFMPEEIRAALQRLQLSEWGSEEVLEYKKDLLMADEFATVLLAERSEGVAEGVAEGRLETLAELVKKKHLSRDTASEGLTPEEVRLLQIKLNRE